jgi:hypothetical protein
MTAKVAIVLAGVCIGVFVFQSLRLRQPVPVSVPPLPATAPNQALDAHIAPVRTTQVAVEPTVPGSVRQQESARFDVQEGIKQFHTTTNLADKYDLIRRLTMEGGPDVFEFFRTLVTTQYAGRTLGSGYGTEDEEGVLFHVVRCMGILAQNDDRAFAFLKRSTSPEYWKATATWTSRRGPDSAGILAATSLQALGISGRSEVPRLLEAMKGEDLRNRVDPAANARDNSGALVSAAFYHDLVTQKGTPYFRDIFMREQIDKEYTDWTKTASGTNWVNWLSNRQ